MQGVKSREGLEKEHFWREEQVAKTLREEGHGTSHGLERRPVWLVSNKEVGKEYGSQSSEGPDLMSCYVNLRQGVWISPKDDGKSLEGFECRSCGKDWLSSVEEKVRQEE